ncbi:UNVERIFIED_CONTAM: hypothetical protein GTU68_010328 [Idotea baltica]|nr:hypothetical protein [Idotea baltica]
MQKAYDQAEIAFENRETPVGAIIVSNGVIIAKAHNQVEQLGDPTAHAEMLAITSATNYLNSKYLNECTLYVTLEPCAMCITAAYWGQIGRIVFGAYDEKRGFQNFEPPLQHPKTELLGGIMAAECGDILKRFFKMRREELN